MKTERLKQVPLSIAGDLRGAQGEILQAFSKAFYTVPDEVPDFPLLTDDALLTLFNNKPLSTSGTLRIRQVERHVNETLQNTSSGGSGFGIMSIIVGIERELYQSH
jgi:hypothetical protein